MYALEEIVVSLLFCLIGFITRLNNDLQAKSYYDYHDCYVEIADLFSLTDNLEHFPLLDHS